MLGVPDIVRGTRGICLTSPVLDGGLAVSLKKALQQIGFTDDQTMIEDYKESFYYYGYSQKPSIWSRSMALVSFHDNEAELFTMSEQKDRKPYPVTVEQKARITLPEDDGEKDLRFSEFIRRELKKDAFSAVFITGRAFPATGQKARSRCSAKAAEGCLKGITSLCAEPAGRLLKNANGTRWDPASIWDRTLSPADFNGPYRRRVQRTVTLIHRAETGLKMQPPFSLFRTGGKISPCP
jgi:hypothetical protein